MGIEWLCKQCKAGFISLDFLPTCPYCGSKHVEPEDTDPLGWDTESVEVDDDE